MTQISSLSDSPSHEFFLLGLITGISVAAFLKLRSIKDSPKQLKLLSDGLLGLWLIFLLWQGFEAWDRLAISESTKTEIYTSVFFGYLTAVALKLAIFHKRGRKLVKNTSLGFLASITFILDRAQSRNEAPRGRSNLNDKEYKSQDPTDEKEDFILIIGTEKEQSQISSLFIDQVREQGETVVVLDPRGMNLKNSFNEDTDFLFNPLDNRSIGWNPLDEVEFEYQIKPVIDAITTRQANELVSISNQLLMHLALKLKQLGLLSIRNLLYVATTMTNKDLELFFKATGFESILNSIEPEILKSVRSYISTRTKHFELMPYHEPKFRLTEMLEVRHSGTIYIPFKSDYLSLTGNGINIFVSTLLSLIRQEVPDDSNHEKRVWIILSEFDQLGFIENLEQALQSISKFNIGIILGCSNVEKVRAVYGDGFVDLMKTADLKFLSQKVEDAKKFVAYKGLAQSPFLDLEEDDILMHSASGSQTLSLKEVVLSKDATAGFVRRTYDVKPSIKIGPSDALRALLDYEKRKIDAEQTAMAPESEDFDAEDLDLAEVSIEDDLVKSMFTKEGSPKPVLDLSESNFTELSKRRRSTEAQNDQVLELYKPSLTKALQELIAKSDRSLSAPIETKPKVSQMKKVDRNQAQNDQLSDDEDPFKDIFIKDFNPK